MRRGVLLLVVLSLLTLFLMLGTTYLIVSTRARKTARAFADTVSGASSSGIAGERLLDEAFMTVVRGTKSGSSAIAAGTDLLGDRYGTSPPETGTILAATGTPVIELTVSATSNPALLAGRVLTFRLPGLKSASTRIIRAEPGKLFIPAGPSLSGKMLSAAAINTARAKATGDNEHFLINGREFDDSGANEPYDGYDLQNLFLASISSGTFSYGLTGAAAVIDNDGDGSADSGWIDVGFPPMLDSAGSIFKPLAAILVVDLDGRINVNTHGSSTDIETCSEAGAYGTGVNLYPDVTIASGTVNQRALPRGSGGGVAEVNVAATSVAGSSTSTGLPELLGGDASNAPRVDSLTQRSRPIIDKPEGRYGSQAWNLAGSLLDVAKPGKNLFNDNSSLDRWTTASGTASSIRFFDDTSSRYGSPPDLKGRMRVWCDAFGQPVYYKPYWHNPTTGRGLCDDEAVDDPYEIDLGPNGPRTGWIHDPLTAGTAASNAKDNLFTAAELEGLLRYFDPDSLRMSRRLVTLSGSNASTNRALVTTDSWDTPAVVGSAWRDVMGTPFASLLSGNAPFTFFAPETIMGHKLDINRPFHDSLYNEPNDATGISRRQLFAKQFYCLLVALVTKNKSSALTDAETEQLAQWAINVVDFRDGDSVMTSFNYDKTFNATTTAWNPTAVVWGCERPEVIITETLAWHNRRTDDLKENNSHNKVAETGLEQYDPTTADNDFDQSRRPFGAFFVELYSPWGSQAKEFDGTSATKDVTLALSGTARGEPLPAELTGTSANRFFRSNTIDVGRTHDGSTTGFPIWRIVSVRGDVSGGTAFGTDPTRPAQVNATKSILDPSRPASSAIVDRVFYLAEPPASLKTPSSLRDGKTGSVFWRNGDVTAQPSQSKYIVVGTDCMRPNFTLAPIKPSDNAYQNYQDNMVHVRFGRNGRIIASLTEPTSEDTTKDAYEQEIALQASGNGNNKFTPDDNSVHYYNDTITLQKTLDTPLDARVDDLPPVSAPLKTLAGSPLLMINGTHDNFAVVHLQRLADPTKAWNSATNPYLTVDSMPVDLTVVNTFGAPSGILVGKNVDEPGTTPTPSNLSQPKLAYLTTQKEFRYSSVERGGKKTVDAPTNANESDIWSRRTFASGTSTADAYTYRSPVTSPRNATALTAATPPLLQESAHGGLQNSTFSISNSEAESRPGRFPSFRYPWLAWPNRPFHSPTELANVPTTSSFHLLGLHSTANTTSPLTPAFSHLTGLLEPGTATAPWNAVSGQTGVGHPSILDFVHVPTRFGGSYTTLSVSNAANAPALATHGLDTYPYNHFSHFREPGRINVNTIPDTSIWRSLFGTRVLSETTYPPAKPLLAKTARDILPSNIDTFTEPHRDARIDSFFRYQTAARLANTATTRSNVFAIWITIGYFDLNGEQQPLGERQPFRRNRGFYIFDRSIPVGYEHGKNNNVNNAILLRRIIE